MFQIKSLILLLKRKKKMAKGKIAFRVTAYIDTHDDTPMEAVLDELVNSLEVSSEYIELTKVKFEEVWEEL